MATRSVGRVFWQRIIPKQIGCKNRISFVSRLSFSSSPGPSDESKEPQEKELDDAISRLSEELSVTALSEEEEAKQKRVWLDADVKERLDKYEREDGPANEFDDILDKKNPPRLEPWHYGLLRNLLALSEPDPNLTVEQIRARERLQQSSKDPDNPLFWDEEAWRQKIKVGRELLPWDPWYELTPNYKSESEVIPQEIYTMKHVVQWDAPGTVPKGVPCLLCREDFSVHKTYQIKHTNVELLQRFLNERGMILSKRVTKTCFPHQRKIGAAIRRARQIGLLSPISNWKVSHEYRTTKLVEPKHYEPEIDTTNQVVRRPAKRRPKLRP